MENEISLLKYFLFSARLKPQLSLEAARTPSLPPLPHYMSPTAVFQPAGNMANGQAVSAAVPVKGPALAIGTLSTAQDGKYQSLVSDLEATRHVDKQMLDRLVDNGAEVTSGITKLHRR